jgi:hypothetical protein
MNVLLNSTEKSFVLDISILPNHSSVYASGGPGGGTSGKKRVTEGKPTQEKDRTLGFVHK